MQQKLLLQCIANQAIPTTPIWFMRQAGRYLPEYLKIRHSAKSFLNLCKNPELATTVTLQPLKRFNLDAAIIFSDILVVPEAMGMELNFIENEGPKFSTPIHDLSGIEALDCDNIEQKLSYVTNTIINCKNELPIDKALIGFSGSPFTLACYMIEGGKSTNFIKIKSMLYNQPHLLHKLLNKLTQAIIIYLKAQIAAGIDVFMLFDSWGGILTSDAYVEFSLSYTQQIINQIATQSSTPSIIFTKGGGIWLDKIAATKVNVIGLDWTMDLGTARNQVTAKHILQGNLDPVLLATGNKESIKKYVTAILNNYKDANNGNMSGLIFNLGHGILPMTNPDNVAYLVDLVHQLTQRDA